MKPPEKPFPTYKWRWATVTPTESLNDPSVFLGVLRVLRRHEGEPPSSAGVLDDLGIVQRETGTTVNLVRTPERNLIRNSGQYWKALNLYGDLSGEISLTPFGTKIADGKITKAEMAATVIKTFELPNRLIQTDFADWDAAGLRIKPFELILWILISLYDSYGEANAFITPDELTKVVIPLAGANAPIEDHVQALGMFRAGTLDISMWADCAPESNDKRMAREFLLFLNFYGICEMKGRGRSREKYYISKMNEAEIRSLLDLDVAGIQPQTAVKKIRKTDFPAQIERKRVLAEVLQRPQQSRFRKQVLEAYGSRCLITGVKLESVLEAAHIRPVSESGLDVVENGLCLRSDIHLLFDSGHLRINPSGSILLSEAASESVNYAYLPDGLEIPDLVNMEWIEWRWKYW